MNIMAVTYSAKATITLESTTSMESCEMIIGESNQLAAGLTNGEYAEINMDGRSVALYVEYQGVQYQHFASAPATMKNLVIGAKTDAATNYNLIISDVTGTFTLKIGDADPFTVTEGTQVITLTANQTASIGVVNYFPKYDVTLNANGLATFSATDAVSIPSGLKAYTATGLTGDVLNLSEITAAQVPANTGVILYGAANGAYELPIIATAAAITETNLLKAATVWPAAAGTVYILHGNELWEYTGSDMKANKAYLQLPAGAPKRIRLAFDQATAIDNVEVEAVKAEKFVENGQIFIRRGNEVFNLQGQIVK